ncbi:peptidoglycan DD-metalloendopeptidase family protein [Arthrobacter echini]|uniref:peptidoglycan DD-metalloendopeptidase family protein n=1 Tax=Arthrobacter echini TaxID=1529066 RepID=UPI0021CD0DA1|nr:peptidoglycan DD-metalloendopeptidase family protein [Arthrobacter echini]
MTQAGKHRSMARVPGRSRGVRRTKMNASLAMVVCFVGFQGVVPQSWEAADAMSRASVQTDSSLLGLDDALSATGSVGSSLMVPLRYADALDATKPREVAPSADSSAATAPLLTDISTAVQRPLAGTLFAPLGELTPTSPFGPRTSPITAEEGELHTGQDFAAPCGTPVYAADAGTVRGVGWHQWGGGNRVEVDHGNGLITTYNHLQGISVETGDVVDGGDPIAEVGTSGSSTGCHLHLETILDGEHVDPVGWTYVPATHRARPGVMKDYTPGGSSVSAVPAWAQSSTRSDQVFGADLGAVPPILDLQPVLGAGSSELRGLLPTQLPRVPAATRSSGVAGASASTTAAAPEPDSAVNLSSEPSKPVVKRQEALAQARPSATAKPKSSGTTESRTQSKPSKTTKPPVKSEPTKSTKPETPKSEPTKTTKPEPQKPEPTKTTKPEPQKPEPTKTTKPEPTETTKPPVKSEPTTPETTAPEPPKAPAPKPTETTKPADPVVQPQVVPEAGTDLACSPDPAVEAEAGTEPVPATPAPGGESASVPGVPAADAPVDADGAEETACDDDALPGEASGKTDPSRGPDPAPVGPSTPGAPSVAPRNEG